MARERGFATVWPFTPADAARVFKRLTYGSQGRCTNHGGERPAVWIARRQSHNGYTSLRWPHGRRWHEAWCQECLDRNKADKRLIVEVFESEEAC
jgi:hypothetical protein